MGIVMMNKIENTDERVPILKVRNLSVTIKNGNQRVKIIEGVSFYVCEGERWAIAGESGAGKSMTIKAITALLPEGSTEITGEILFRMPDGGWQDLLQIPYRQRHRFVAKQIAIIFQDAIHALNPNERILRQWGETVALHKPELTEAERKTHLLERMEIFGVRGGERTLGLFPDQLSGGMRQRIAIAMALESPARILIADEPTTSLDAISQRNTITFIQKLLERNNLTLLFISHNLAILQAVCDHIIIMKDGKIVEQGTTQELFFDAKEQYTQELVRETMKIMGTGSWQDES